MRILELEIINFGKFNHETVTFHDGMNLIYGENEMGKTTLHSFIRGMFFGIEKQRGRAARKDEYSIREPWFHAGQFAGIMRFESAAKSFVWSGIFTARKRASAWYARQTVKYCP